MQTIKDHKTIEEAPMLPMLRASHNGARYIQAGTTKIYLSIDEMHALGEMMRRECEKCERNLEPWEGKLCEVCK